MAVLNTLLTVQNYEQSIQTVFHQHILHIKVKSIEIKIILHVSAYFDHSTLKAIKVKLVWELSSREFPFFCVSPACAYLTEGDVKYIGRCLAQVSKRLTKGYG